MQNQEVMKETNDQSQRLVGDCFFCTSGRTYGEVFLLGSLVRGGFGVL